MGYLYTPARPRLVAKEPLPRPLVPHIIALADEIDAKKAELSGLMRAAELQDLARFEHIQKIESGKLGSSLPDLPNFNENED